MEGETLAREPGTFEERLVLPVVEVVVVSGTANPVGEHKVVIVPPGSG